MPNGTKSHGLTLIEFFLSIISLFLFLIISYPILVELKERNQKDRIKDNLILIRNHSKNYFNQHAVESVSIYSLVGPRKPIAELNIILDEEYPQSIIRSEEISAKSKKFGKISIK